MRLCVWGFGALAGVAVLIGCGGGGLKEEDYLHEANAICGEAAKRLEKLPEPSSLREVAKVKAREVAIREKVVAALGELTPPLELAGGADNVYADQEAREERAKAIEEAAKKKDRKEYRKLREEERTEFPIEETRARTIGLHACAKL